MATRTLRNRQVESAGSGPLITVGGGFLAAAVARHLVASGRPARLLVRPGTPASPGTNLPGVQTVEGDVNATKSLPGLLSGAGTVYFVAPAAALAGPKGDWNPSPILLACADAGVHLVVAVSIALYKGAGHPPFDEKTEFEARGGRGEAQFSWENAARLEGLKRRFPVTILRLPTLLGGGLPDPEMRDAVGRAKDGLPISFRGREEEIVEFLHVDDAARACLLAADRPDARGETIHVPGHPIRRKNLLRVLAKVAGSSSEVIVVPPREAPRDRRGQADPSRDFWVRGDKAKRLLGFSPLLSYEQAFRASLEPVPRFPF